MKQNTVTRPLLAIVLAMELFAFTAQAQGADETELKNRALAGDAKAMTGLALFYLNGADAKKHGAETVKWLQKAADLGDVSAMVYLGVCYFYGNGVPENRTETLKWATMAAKQGDTSGLRLAGDHYWNKLLNEKNWHSIYQNFDSGAKQANTDKTLAIRWYEKAADFGDAVAMSRLGDYYNDGPYVSTFDPFQTLQQDKSKRDATKCLAWYRKAAECGDTHSIYQLGSFYCEGNGVLQDYNQALILFQAGAKKGNRDCMASVGHFYDQGIGVARDEVLAYAWYNLASLPNESGLCSSDYAKKRDGIRSLLKPEEISEAQRLTKIIMLGEVDADGSRKGVGIAKIGRDEKAPSGTGTGFFVTTNGYFVTAAHVVYKASSIKIVLGGVLVPARLVRMEVTNDVALLKADCACDALSIASQSSVHLGAEVFTVGFPNIGLQGVSPKLTKGSVNALSGIQDDPRAFQISVPIQPGNSGGPLLDTSGNVVGVVVSQLDAVKTAQITGSLPQGVNYAVKSAYVQPLLDTIPKSSALPLVVKGRTFDDAVKAAESAVCIVLAYEAAQ